MPDSDKFDFDLLMDEEVPHSGDDFFSFDDENDNKDTKKSDVSFNIPANEKKPDTRTPKRSSADFSPDMDALLLTAQSSMITDAMRFISQHDFKSKNVSVFSEAIKGIDLYMKILERNPGNFNKLTAILASDQDCTDVLNITYNLYKSAYGDLPETYSQKLKAFELMNEKLKIACNKSLISSSIVSIKKYFLLSGSLDLAKIDGEFKNDYSELKKQIGIYMRHINIGRQLIKSGNAELVKGMKGKELNVFIIKASELLVYYFGRSGETELQTFYRKLHDNFKQYFIIR